jgi:hypothetical protein
MPIDAGTGRIVKKSYVSGHKKTTVTLTVPTGKKKK